MISETGSMADNDNGPLCAHRFTDLAARRAFLASIRGKAEPVLAWPTFERLAHLGDATKLGALMRWRDITEPARYIAANDNNDAEEELRREIRPSVPELLAAAGNAGVEFGEKEERHIVRLGELVFNFDPARRRHPGLLTEWGTTAKGKSLKPVDRARAPMGRRPAKRSAEAVKAYLARPAAIPSSLAADPHQRPMGGVRGAGMYDPLPREKPSTTNEVGRYGVNEARAELAALGVDGSVRFADLPFPATKCPTFILHGPQWTGGVSAIKGSGGDGLTTAVARGHYDAAVELARIAEAERLRNALGEHADVLDMAVTDSTAEEIGVAEGYAPSSAKKFGARLIDRAIAEYLAIAA
ncbi:hypothetical protein [Mesorhizobium ventifaucium]|uniref:Uncharacterized protein n=1 Tax=Mesorhizobium ventifaucium TaxID=666020 RepID=A0ABN8KGU8_9HYPH|nr:hypothetical protein [Mesorhizobium ventifaucium]CAH2408003.1 conserved hypothetical protein [Mesorhizobium ventifaucium]